MPVADERVTPDSAATTWRLGGAAAAIAHGAPAVGTSDGPLELYVPGPVLLTVCARRYGAADPLSAVASVAVPAAHQVTGPWDPDRDRRAHGWPLAHPVAAALDLAAQSDARSRQILADWSPSGAAVWHDG